MRELFNILAQFFSVKAGEIDKEQIHEESEHEGGNPEPHEEPAGESDDGPGESQDVGGEAGKPEHPVTPKKNTPRVRVMLIPWTSLWLGKWVGNPW